MEGHFQGRKPETAQISAVSRQATPFLSAKRQEKPLRFQRFSGERTSRTKCYRRCNRREVMKLSVRERRRWTTFGELPNGESSQTASLVPRCNRGHDRTPSRHSSPFA